MNETGKSFWEELKTACQKKKVDFDKIKAWIDLRVGNLTERMLAYHISIEDPALLIDIVILTELRVYGFSIINRWTKNYHTHVIKKFSTILETIEGKKVHLKFYQTGRQESFYLKDDAKHSQKLVEFVKRFAELAWG